MIKAKFMKPGFLILLSGIYLFSLTFLYTQPASAQAGADYEYYKKTGHSNKMWDESVKRGFEAYDKQDCEGALASLKEAIAAQCQDGLVFYKIAVCSETTGSPYTALQYYQLAEEKLMKLPQIHRYQQDIFESYGRALFQAKRYDQAFPYLQRAAAIGTPSFGLYYMVGFLSATKGDMRAAIEMFEKALAQDTTGVPPTTLAVVYREVAKAYHANKDFQKSSQLADKALALNPNDPEATKIKNETSSMASQQSMINMIDGMTKQQLQDPGAPRPPGSLPPPPAAAKLPPLNPQPIQDPTPPMGNMVQPGTPAPPAPSYGASAPPPVTTSPTTAPPPPTAPAPAGAPTKLEPLPPTP